MSVRTRAAVLAATSTLIAWGFRAHAVEAPPTPSPSSQPSSQPAGTFTIGKDTTRIDGPIRPDGTIDYLGALNARMSEGVTPANNAVVGLVRTLGAASFRLEDAKRDKFLQRLGIELPPQDGSYYVGPEEYVDQHGQGDEADKTREALRRPDDKPWTAAEQPLLATWITSQDAAITRIADAVALPKFYLPLVSTSDPESMFGTVGQGLNPIRAAGRALSYRASFRLGNGDFEGFRSDLRSLSRLSRHLATRPLYIDQLVAGGLDALVVATVSGAATGGRLTTAQAKVLAADLDAQPPLPSTAAAIDIGERYILLDYFVTAARHGWAKAASTITGGGRPRSYVYAGVQTRDWDVVLRKANTWFDRQVTAIAAPTEDERRRAGEEFDREMRKMRARLEGPFAFTAPIEDRMLSILAMPMRAAERIRAQNDFRRDMCHVALGLASFRADRGTYPSKLDDLVPMYVSAIPTDRFAKNAPALMYEVNALGGYRLASVGQNGTDDRRRAADGLTVDDFILLGGKQPPPPAPPEPPKGDAELELDVDRPPPTPAPPADK